MLFKLVLALVILLFLALIAFLGMLIYCILFPHTHQHQTNKNYHLYEL